MTDDKNLNNKYEEYRKMLDKHINKDNINVDYRYIDKDNNIDMLIECQKYNSYFQKFGKNNKLMKKIANFSDVELDELEDEFYKKMNHNKYATEAEKIIFEILYIEKAMKKGNYNNLSNTYNNENIEQILKNLKRIVISKKLKPSNYEKIKLALVEIELKGDLDISFLKTFKKYYKHEFDIEEEKEDQRGKSR